MTKTRGATTAVSHDFSPLTDDDLYLFNEGSFFHMYEKLGAHRETVDGTDGVFFAVWAPNAGQVSVVGDFNGWDKASHPLRPGPARASGRGSSPASRPAPSTSTRSSHETRSIASRRPIRWRSTPKRHPGRHQSYGTSTTNGATSIG